MSRRWIPDASAGASGTVSVDANARFAPGGTAVARRLIRARRAARRVLLGIVLVVIAACATAPPVEEVEPTPTAPDVTAVPTLTITDVPAVATASPVQIALELTDIDPSRIAALEIVLLDPESGAVLQALDHPWATTVSVPLSGVVDGDAVTVAVAARIAGGDRLVALRRPTITTDFGHPVPAAAPDAPRRTLDPHPSIRLTLAGDEVLPAGAEVEIEYRVERAGATAANTPDATAAAGPESNSETAGATPEARRETVATLEWRPAEPLAAASADGATRLVGRARYLAPDGTIGRWSSPAAITYDRTLAPRPIAGVGLIRAARAFLAWDEVAGAARYVVTVDPDGLALTYETSDTSVTVSRADLEAVVATAPAPVITWTVVAEGPQPWAQSAPSSRVAARWEPLTPAMEVVLPVGERAVVIVGDGGQGGDEAPEAPVVLTRPVAFARTETTVALVAEILNGALDGGRATLDGSRVRDAATGLPLFGVDALELGAQVAIEVSDGRLRPADGYAAHPAVGVTWYGALFIGNELSRFEGLAPATAFTPDGVVVDIDAPGYRLPTEAEWALAAARPAPAPRAAQIVTAWFTPPVDGANGDVTAPTGPPTAAPVTPPSVFIESWPLTAVDRRSVNFLRSDDRWEDPVPPHTANGGPTWPVGAGGLTSRTGLRDLIGNAWEWTLDWYAADAYAALARVAADDAALPVDPTGPAEATPDVYGRTLRVVRGLGWNSRVEEIRPTNRGSYQPEAASYTIGFRLARTLGVPTALEPSDRTDR